MNKSNSARTVTFGDLKDELMAHIWVILGAAVLCVALFLGYNLLTFTPEYESRATLYILKQDGGAKDEYTSSDFSLALNVVNDCTYLLRSHKVLDDVITQLNLNCSYEQLARCISTSNPDGTRVLEVIVRAASPELAQQIVDAVCHVGAQAISEAMGFQQVNLYEDGTLNRTPCNRTGYKIYALVGIGAAVLTYAIYLMIFLLDDKIRTEEDVHDYLGLSVLGEIPNANDKGHGGYGKQYGKSKYAYYSRYEPRKSPGTGKKEG